MRRGLPARLVAALLAAGVSLVALVSPLASTSAGATGSSAAPPYTDPNVTGTIGLCDASGHLVTQGTIAATPFVSSAVSSVAPPRGYGGAGRTAALFLYQPRTGVAPGDWSGQLMTSSSQYTNAQHPMTVATGGDPSLADFLSTFPATWSGYLELRLYLGAPGQPQYTQTYAATDIRVTGQTWQVARGGVGPCGSGTAVSLESRELPKSLTDPDTTVAPTPSPSSDIDLANPTIPTKILRKGSSSRSKVQEAGAGETSGRRGSGAGIAVVALVVGLVVLVAAAAIFSFQRRRSPSLAEPPSTEEPHEQPD